MPEPLTTPESIWKSETEQALKNMIEHCMNIKAFIRVPEEPLKTEVFPCITIYGLYDVHAIYRRQYDSRPLIVRKESTTAAVEKPPDPFDLYYQLDFWSLNNREINDMTMIWLDQCASFFNLDCRDRSDNVRNIFCRQAGNLKRADYDVENKTKPARVFRATIDYRIWVEIYERKTYNVPIVVDGGMNFSLDKLMKGE